MADAGRRDVVLDRIAGIIRASLREPDLAVTEETRAEHVDGWDSLSHVAIILGVEKAFGIRLKASEVAKLENVGSLADIAMARGKF